MYLKLADRLSPKKVALALAPHLRPEQVEWDCENVYEWAYVDLPDLSFSLDITRDHGMSDRKGHELDQLSPEAIEALPTAGPTYIFGFDRHTNTHVPELATALIQRISDSVHSEILIYPGRINIAQPDPQPIGRTSPKR